MADQQSWAREAPVTIKLLGPDANPTGVVPSTSLQAFLLRNLSARVAVNVWWMAALGAAAALLIGLAITYVIQLLLAQVVSNAIDAVTDSSIGAQLAAIVAKSYLTPDALKLFAIEHRIPLVLSVGTR